MNFNKEADKEPKNNILYLLRSNILFLKHLRLLLYFTNVIQ